MFQDLLNKHNLKYEDLNSQERETLRSWVEATSKNELTVQKITEYIGQLKDAVEEELSAYDLPKEKDLLLKARLKNYRILHNFLTAPERARKLIEESLKNIKK